MLLPSMILNRNYLIGGTLGSHTSIPSIEASLSTVSVLQKPEQLLGFLLHMKWKGTVRVAASPMLGLFR